MLKLSDLIDGKQAIVLEAKTYLQKTLDMAKGNVGTLTVNQGLNNIIIKEAERYKKAIDQIIDNNKHLNEQSLRLIADVANKLWACANDPNNSDQIYNLVNSEILKQPLVTVTAKSPKPSLFSFRSKKSSNPGVELAGEMKNKTPKGGN